MVLQPLNALLTQRMQQRNEIPATTISYHDDTSIVIPFADLSWFLQLFHQLGEPLGIRLNFFKTKILTSLTTESPIPYLNLDDQCHLQHALQLLGPHAEERQGTRLLGQPVGSHQFAVQYIHEALTKLQQIISQQLMHRIQDSQTQTSLLKNCVIPSLTHLLAADVYHQYSDPLPTLYHWTTPLTQTLNLLVHQAIAEITHTHDLPIHAIPIVHLPVTLGGIGLRDPSATAIPSVITTYTRSLRYAIHGIYVHNATLPVPKVLTDALLPSRFYHILSQLSPLFLDILPKTTSTPASTVDEHITTTSLLKLQQHFYHVHQSQIHSNLLHQPPLHLQSCIHSILSPLTSIPLLSLSRRIPTNRLSNPTFRLLLQRKLRLPILPPQLQHTSCLCKSHAPLDPYGDHFFSCTQASKIPLHNTIRNTLFHVLQIIAPLAHITLTQHDTQLEPPNLIPSLPTLRPADIGLQLIPTPKQLQTYLAIDVTVTATPKSSLAACTDLPVKNTLQQAHEHSARLKFNIPHAHYFPLHNMILLPFTVDHLGGIGPYAHQFLYGTKNPAIPPIAPIPQWTPNSFLTNPAAFQLVQNTEQYLPKNILQQATHAWSHGQHQQQNFGKSYHTRTPTNWATQAIALNLTLALAKHLQQHIETLTRLHNRSTQKHANDALHRFPPFFLPPPPFLTPTELSVQYHLQYHQFLPSPLSQLHRT